MITSHAPLLPRRDEMHQVISNRRHEFLLAPPLIRSGMFSSGGQAETPLVPVFMPLQNHQPHQRKRHWRQPLSVPFLPLLVRLGGRLFGSWQASSVDEHMSSHEHVSFQAAEPTYCFWGPVFRPGAITLV